ncbi:MAG: dTMP kinase [Clostridia bacterium]|nr:dTMP kinase [Clostridia bacterium]MBR7033120.1 dTMP kinase [Clostridia bacterium]
MEDNKSSGKLITFCGLDGCGKTTQINKLEEWLTNEGYKVFLTKQPTDYVRKSEIFRNFSDSPDNSRFEYRALSLFCAADRLQHTRRVIKDKLEKGYIVICDRYFYSCLANLIARGYTDDVWIYEIAKSIIKPDVSFFLSLPVEKAIGRVRRRPEEKDRYINPDFQKRLHDLYIEIAQKNKGIIVSSLLSEETCFERIKFEVNRIVKK